MLPLSEEKPKQLRYRMPPRNYKYGDMTRQFTVATQPVDHIFLRERYDYTYEFKPAAVQRDPVIALICKAIDKLEQSIGCGVLMCSNNFQVVPSTTAPPVWPLTKKKNMNKVKFYTFLQDDTEFSATAPVSIIPRKGTLTVDKVHVRSCGKWVPIKSWLPNIADEHILFRRGVEAAADI